MSSKAKVVTFTLPPPLDSLVIKATSDDGESFSVSLELSSDGDWVERVEQALRAHSAAPPAAGAGDAIPSHSHPHPLPGRGAAAAPGRLLLSPRRGSRAAHRAIARAVRQPDGGRGHRAAARRQDHRIRRSMPRRVPEARLLPGGLARVSC